MNRISLGVFDWTTLVNGITSHIENTTKNPIPNWHANGSSSCCHRQTTLQPFAPTHSDRPYPTFPEVLLNFKNEFRIDAIDIELNFEGFINLWENSRDRKIDVHNGADDLDDGAGIAHNDWELLLKIG